MADTYSYIWQAISTLRGSEQRLDHRARSYAIWFGLKDAAAWNAAFGDKAVLDAGAGCGMAAHFLLPHVASLHALDISAGIEAAAEYWAREPKYVPVQADVKRMPFRDGVFDVVFTVGVLHHTPSTRAALVSCLRVLRPGGRIFFYIYRRKSPIREFSDDYVRTGLADLPPSAAWRAVAPFSALGEALARVREPVQIIEAIPALGIKPGSYSVRDLVDRHLLGCFWSPVYSRAENDRVNLDWYYPRYAHRHRAEEVWRWLAQLGLAVERFRATDNGIAVIASKPAA